MQTASHDLIKLAAFAAGCFIQKPRGDETISTTTDAAPQWIQDLCHKAHGDMLPDDHRYVMIADSVQAIAEAEEGDDLDDLCHTYADGAVSMWNGKRAEWLASHITRSGYVDEAVENMGAPEPFDIYVVIGWGWYEEAREVFESVRSSLVSQTGAEQE